MFHGWGAEQHVCGLSPLAHVWRHCTDRAEWRQAGQAPLGAIRHAKEVKYLELRRNNASAVGLLNNERCRMQQYDEYGEEVEVSKHINLINLGVSSVGLIHDFYIADVTNKNYYSICRILNVSVGYTFYVSSATCLHKTVGIEIGSNSLQLYFCKWQLLHLLQ